MFEGTSIRLLAGCAFTSLLVVASVSDLRSRRIPNKVVAWLAVLGLVFSTTTLPGFRGLLFGLAGLGVGFAIWFPFYPLRLLGAGDVKLFAAASAWLGPALTFKAALIAMIAGGVLALVVLALQRRLREGAEQTALLWTSWTRLRQFRAAVPVSQASRQLPYGVALAIGAATAAWFPGLSF